MTLANIRYRPGRSDRRVEPAAVICCWCSAITVLPKNVPTTPRRLRKRRISKRRSPDYSGNRPQACHAASAAAVPAAATPAPAAVPAKPAAQQLASR